MFYCFFHEWLRQKSEKVNDVGKFVDLRRTIMVETSVIASLLEKWYGES